MEIGGRWRATRFYGQHFFAENLWSLLGNCVRSGSTFSTGPFSRGLPARNPSLVAPYCAIPRDFLSDTPLLRSMGFLVSQHGQLSAIPPPPFLGVSPLESMRSGGAIPPPQKGYLSDTCTTPYETRQMGAIPPSAILSRKGMARHGVGVSHWAAKSPSSCSKNPVRLTLS